jgi:hypothetical protein
MKNFGQKFCTGIVGPAPFTLGVRSEKEASNASLSLRHLSLWLKAKAPNKWGQMLGTADKTLCGASPICFCSRKRIDWDVTKRAHPAVKRLAHSEPSRNTVLVQVTRIDNKVVVRVGSRHPFHPKKNGPLDVNEYGKKTPDESQQRANPGNGQVLDPATAATSRFKGIPARVIKLLLRFQTLLVSEYVVALSGERLNAKRKPPLWRKLI